MGWLIACVLAVCLWQTRRQLKRLMSADPAQSETESTQPVLSSYHNVPSAYRLLHNLIVLRLELQHLQGAEAFDTAHYAHLTAHIDTLWSNIVRSLGTPPQSQPWQQARDAAWEVLAEKHALLGPPPWAREEAQATPEVAPGAAALTPPAHLYEALMHRVEVPPLRPPTASEPVPPLTVPVTAAQAFDATGESALPPASISPSSPEETASYAWEPAAPGALERALQAVSGWPALIAPFLVQNIGWFIGGACFVAGSVFLVAYTTGFAKTLASFAVLSVYTLLLLWGGYQIRRRRPALEMSSSALLILGLLLVPLNVAAAVRLILVAQRSLGLMALGLLAAGVGVVGLYITATLVSGVLERALQRQYPRLFLALAAIQLVVPLLAQQPVWPLLMLCHGAVVGLLAYGFVLFTQDWLRSIFLERRKLAYYAAGTLVYAALVSFVHLSWGYQAAAALPPGYYGPWLIILCGLLFYVDAHLKRWEQHAAFLSQVSFGLYGLSVLALLLAVQGPLALLCTLALAVVLYGLVTWQYATLPPLYLLLGCAGWLYHEVVLHHVPYALYFLASLPGFASLWAATWWALRRRATVVALVGYRVLGVALLSVATWSVVHSQPGWVALGTAVLLMGFAFAAPRLVPAQVLGRGQGGGTRVVQHIWLYLGTGAGVVAAAYAPAVSGLVWAVQLAWGLLLLATVWTALGLRLSRVAREDTAARSEALLNSAVLYLGVCLSVLVLLALPDMLRHRVLPLLLGLQGGIALWLSLTLGVQWLFYGVLGLWGAAGVIVKLTYFPAAGNGTTVMGIGLLIWVVLWWVEHAPAEVTALRQARVGLRAARAASLTLLGLCPVAFAPLPDVVRVPLRQAMVLLWGLGSTHLGMRLLAGYLGWGWVASASLGALLAGLLTGSLPWPWLLPVSMTLGWGAVLVAAGELGVTTAGGLSVISAVYAALVWKLGVTLLSHPAMGRFALLCHQRGDRTRLECITHWTAFTVTVLSISMPLAHYGVFVPSAAMLLTLGTGMAFWWLAGQRYQHCLNRYLVLESGALGIVLGYVWVFHTVSVPLMTRWQILLSAPGLGLTCVLLSVGLWSMAWIAWRHPEAEEASLRRAGSAGAEEFLLYHKPLQVVAVQLALLAAVQSLGLVSPAVIGGVYTGGFFALAVLGLAGMSLLCATQAGFRLVGLMDLVFAVLGAQSVWFHGTPVAALWFGQPMYVDQWCTLALLALGLASLAQYVAQVPRWAPRYTRPLYVMATLTYGWALLGAMVLFGPFPVQDAAAVAWVFLVLALGLLPLAQSLPEAAFIRGLGMALLLSASVISALAGGGWQACERLLLVVWAYVLWGVGNFALPRYNARWPHWAIAPAAWPWLGLLLVCGALGVWGVPWRPEPPSAALRLGGYLTAVALYLFLLLRNSPWGGWPWVAVGTLTWAGLAFQAAWLWLPTSGLALRLPWVALATSWRGVGGAVVWANVLLLGVTAWRRYGPAVSLRLGWQPHDLCTPLLVWPSAVLSVCLLYLALWDTSAILIHAWALPSLLHGLPAVLLGVLLSASFCHVAWLHSVRWSLHGCITALFCTLLAAWCETVAGVFHPPLYVALWSVLLVLVAVLAARWQWPANVLAAVRVWCDWSPLAAVGVWGLFPHIPIAEHLVILGLLGGYAAGLGWQRQHSAWLLAALVAGVIQLHGWWLVWLSPQAIVLLWPWYTLQLAGLTWGVLWAQERLRLVVETGADGTAPAGCMGQGPVQPLAQALAWLLPLLATLTLLTWALHLLHVLNALIAHRAPQWLLGWGEGVMAVLAVVALLAAGIRQARWTEQGWWIYGIAVVGGTVWVYVRVLWMGLAPVQVWDTVALIGASYALFILQRLTQSTPLLHVVVLLPLLAVATAPLQLASIHSSGVLLTVAMLYLGMRQSTGRAFPLYMGLLTLNVGIYLWVPGWVHAYHLLQLYTIPAAVSVLWLLHAHRHELRPSVLHGGRLAATSILYVSATLDVFLRPEVTIFVAALGLSLAGIIIGIALRTRAFLYASTSFFMLNVVGQLILLFPEQRLTRAIVLLALGTLITGSMIWFNIQREAVLQRIRIFRADLATWA